MPVTMSAFEIRRFAERLEGFVQFYTVDVTPEEELSSAEVALLRGARDLLNAYLALEV